MLVFCVNLNFTQNSYNYHLINSAFEVMYIISLCFVNLIFHLTHDDANSDDDLAKNEVRHIANNNNNYYYSKQKSSTFLQYRKKKTLRTNHNICIQKSQRPKAFLFKIQVYSKPTDHLPAPFATTRSLLLLYKYRDIYGECNIYNCNLYSILKTKN